MLTRYPSPQELFAAETSNGEGDWLEHTSQASIMYLMRSEKIHWRMLASEVSGNENFHASGRGGS